MPSGAWSAIYSSGVGRHSKLAPHSGDCIPRTEPGACRTETIYNAIYAYPRGELRKQLIAMLRQGKSTRRRRSAGDDRRGRIPEMVSIHMRPPEVADRLMLGHWEGDLITGAGNKSAVGVLVERTTRLVLLCQIPDVSAESALAAFTAKLNLIAHPWRPCLRSHTSTVDRPWIP